jgi:RNA polymerase sigma factor (sigma-70 family)
MIDASTITAEPTGDFAWEAVLSTLVARAVRAHVPLPREELQSLSGVALARARDRYDPDRATCSLREWLYSQGWRFLLSEVRNELRRRRQIREVTFTDLSPGGEVPHRAPAHEEPVAETVCFRALMRSFTTDERMLVRLRLERRTHAEIARLCGLSRETVRVRLHRIGLRVRGEGARGV